MSTTMFKTKKNEKRAIEKTPMRVEAVARAPICARELLALPMEGAPFWKGHHSQVGVIEGTKCRSVGPQAVGGDQSIRAATVPLARRKDFRIGRSNSRCHLGLKNNVSACTERHTHIRQRASI
ncbi:hypothetical protein QE152_g6730 [Popillia japonica]|uniref:Uncharacterized protein n=1 Tax=Popillia japonica TaxID=7064 RepID=A0AAW1MFY0_POPJA